MRKSVIAVALMAGVASTAIYAQTTSPTAPVAAATTPKLGTFGVETANMDKAVAPGDDFYQFVNGTWQAKTEIPADRSSWGGFAILRDLSDQRTRAVIEDAAKAQNAPGSVGEKIGVTYASLHGRGDDRGRARRRSSPTWTRSPQSRPRPQLATAFGKATRRGMDVPVGVGVAAGPQG